MIDFENNTKTLKEISLDNNNNIYMTNLELEVIDFDKIKDIYCKNEKIIETLQSNDALYKDENGNIIFIEFKNGKIDKKVETGLKFKIYDSVLIYSDMTGQTLSQLKQTATYILVYNFEKNKDNKNFKNNFSTEFNTIAKSISNFTQTEHINFGLSKFKNYCFKDVHTYTVDEFENFMKKITIKGLSQKCLTAVPPGGPSGGSLFEKSETKNF